MPRTNIAGITPKGPYPTLPISANAADFTPAAADVANKNSTAFGSARQILLIVQNTDTGTQTFTITSVIDQFNRTGDITAYSLSTNEFGAFLADRGWLQSDGALYYEGSHAGVKFAPFLIT